jgi:hypothetical protein
MANVVIDIAAEFTGNKAFKQAETSTDKLIKSTKKLAGAVGLAFGTAQIIAFGKASVKAALEAQAQQQRLAQLVRVTVGASDAQIDSLNDQAEALQKIGVVNKENITQTQSQLATFNLQIDTIKALTPAILDYVTAEKGAAASADQFKQMTNGLAQALNGNFASLTKVGFVLDEQTKKTIKSGTESQRAAALVKVLDSTYKDFNKSLADTPTGQMQKLVNAADDAKQVIGTGLLDAMKELGGENGIGLVTDAIDELALGLAESIVSTARLVKELQELPVVGGFLGRLFSNPLNLPKEFLAFGEGGLIDAYRSYGRAAGIQKASDNAHLKSLSEQFKVIRKTNEVNKRLTADELKKLKAARLKNAIDKANLALNKGEDVFDMDKIQIAAALTNQAQQLGKATSAAQVLQIANDTARLNVKKSILELEDAIASKDEAAIIAATKKLNADLSVLNALTGQKNQMAAIESILAGLKPKDLIDQKNLDEALRKIREMLALLAQVKTPTITPPSDGGGGGGGGGGGFIQTPNGIRPTTEPRSIAEINKATEDLGGIVSVIGANGREFIKLVDGLAPVFQTIEDSGAFNALVNSYAGGAINPFNAGSFRAAEGGSIFSSGAVGSRDRDVTITINAGIGSDPNAIAEAIDNVLREARDRGTLTIA